MSDLIQRLVDRFLGWKLPKDFHPDAGITFTPPNNEAWWPVGTNLFTADQAKQMFEQIVTPELEPQQARIRTLEELLREARQYVSDAGNDEDPDVQRLHAELLRDIDTALSQE